jgi:hypothetical protein
MSATDGSLTRSFTAVRSFQVKGNGTGAESCAS